MAKSKNESRPIENKEPLTKINLLEKCETDLKNAKEGLSTQTNINVELQKNLNSANFNIENFENDLETANEGLSSQTNINIELQKNLNSANFNIENFENDLETANEGISSQNNINVELQKKLNTANINIQNFENDLETANEVFTMQNIINIELQKNLTSANIDIENLEKIQKIYEKGLNKIMFIISHKIRNPVAQIMGLSILLEDGVNNPKDVKKIIGFIKKSSILLEKFTKELTLFVANQENIKDDL